MRIAVPAESQTGERRVAATPKTVEQLTKLGYAVLVQSKAGKRAGFDDAAYEAAGARIAPVREVWGEADVITKINPPNDAELGALRDGATLVSLISPRTDQALLDRLAERDLTVLAMDAVPRISRAQALDVLSSMANIAGYRAVVEAAHEFGSLFTGQVTAAGKIPPAKVLVIGAGVAGLAAIGTVRSLGAIVRATDARPEVAEQVESMGAEFLTVDVGRQEVSSDGYAKETSADYDAAAARLYAEQCREVDIVITTALIPGRPAPRLLTDEMVASMKPGSVIVDMAAANGGNVAGSVANELVTTREGVKIIGYTDLPGRLPTQASQLFGTNVVNLMKLLTPGKDGELVLDLDDDVQRGMLVQRGRERMWPPPPIAVSAAPPAAPAPSGATAAAGAPAPAAPRRSVLPVAAAVAAVLLLLLAPLMPATFVGHFMVFMLACVIGFYVIGNVHHALHTPLMSVTNAISGIIVIGAIWQIGGSGVVQGLSFVAIALASINIVGGFLVTRRMLDMFRKA